MAKTFAQAPILSEGEEKGDKKIKETASTREGLTISSSARRGPDDGSGRDVVRTRLVMGDRELVARAILIDCE